MLVYITYDRYECDEWYQIYHISKTRSGILKTLKQDLIDFLTYGPDDCHSFQCQRIEMSEDDYKKLIELNGGTDASNDPEDSDLIEFMIPIFEESGRSPNSLILSTDGPSEWFEMVDYYNTYIRQKGQRKLEYDEFFELMDSNPGLQAKVLNEYIRDAWNIS